MARKNKEKKTSLIATFRVIFAYMGKFKKDTLLAWVFVFLETVCETMVAFFMRYLVRGIKASDFSTITNYSLIIAACVIVAAATGILSGFWAASAACGFAANLREGMFRKIQRYSFKNIDHFSTSSIVTRTTTDVTNVQNAFQMALRAVVRAPFLMTLAIIMSFVTEWKVAWIFVALVPIVLTVLLLLARTVHPTFVKVFDTYDNLNQSVQENVDGIRVVKAFNREDFEKKRFGGVSGTIYRLFVHAERLLAFNQPTLNFAINATLLGLSFFGATLIVKSGGTDLDTGSLTTLITYVQMIFMSLLMVSMVYVMITIARNSAERIAAIILEEPDIKVPENAIFEVKSGDISFQNVQFSYNEGKPILQNINLDIASGSTLGIIGSTGSGKTTLISLIARLYDVDSGSVTVGGEDVRKYDVSSLRESVAVVLQKNTLFTGTIRDNLRWGNENATDEEIWKACDIAQCSEFLHSFPQGLDTQIDEGGTNVSGGQKQRLCIARALLKNPKILILDDSTSACDTGTDGKIRRGLREHRNDVTKLIIAQRVLSIKDCDQIIVMNDGQIVGMGTNEELIANNEIYRTLYESQLGGGGDFDAASNA